MRSGDADLELAIFGGEEVRTFPLPKDGTVSIGRGEGCALRIDDPSVSRNHAVLRVGDGIAVEDVGSANGTMVRSRAGGGSAASETLNVRHLLRREAVLSVGDSILFGTTTVVVRHRPAVEAIDLTAGPSVIVRDPAMRAIYEQAALAARSPINVLILGETGVGKEVLAHAIHAHSKRATGPILSVNCATLTESLQESELFGYERGAFTGANQAHAGLFEAASGGTVFLDEVGELAPAAQAKLLRVLEQRTVKRLGSSHERPVDVRFVAATNRDLESQGEGARFRQDLFFRLNGISLCIPPLRERPQEIEPLARAFLAMACREIERAELPRLSAETLAILQRHQWPGNVRELRNAIGRAVALCLGDVLAPEHLPPPLLKAIESHARPAAAAEHPAPPALASSPAGGATLQSEIDALEAAKIRDALDRCGGNQTQAARLLGISRGTLISRLPALGITRPRKRD